MQPNLSHFYFGLRSVIYLKPISDDDAPKLNYLRKFGWFTIEHANSYWYKLQNSKFPNIELLMPADIRARCLWMILPRPRIKDFSTQKILEQNIPLDLKQHIIFNLDIFK